MLVAIYVDDIVIAHNCGCMFSSFNDKLTSRSKCKDLGELTKVLKMLLTRILNEGLFVFRDSYVFDLLERFKEHVPAATNSAKLPADPKVGLHAGGSETTGERRGNEGAWKC